MIELNETHNPELLSWVLTANHPESDFPIQNLPFAVFRHSGSEEPFRGGVAIGDQVIDLSTLAASGLLEGKAMIAAEACCDSSLNRFMAMGAEYWSALRLNLSRLLRQEAGIEARSVISTCLIAQTEVEYDLPCRIGDYTDFYTSIYHATAVGSLFRPDNPLLPNYKWVPIGYHGRASSIGISGQAFNRPMGQLKAPDAEVPVTAPCKRLDYELELGILIGRGNELGEQVTLDQVDQHVFGICLLNDWSARDIQAWEYQPLGPFLAKNFASTLSPWVVTTEALLPFRQSWSRPAEDPQPLPYLDSEQNRAAGALDIRLEVLLETEQMRAEQQAPCSVSRSSFVHSYWTVAQMVTHHTVNGCNMQPGDLLGSGTQSGPEAEEAGSLLELSNGGKQPLALANGEQRTFLEDGDCVVMRGWCEKPGATRIGFGEVRGLVLPART